MYPTKIWRNTVLDRALCISGKWPLRSLAPLPIPERMAYYVLYCLHPKHVNDTLMGFPGRTLVDQITNVLF